MSRDGLKTEYLTRAPLGLEFKALKPHSLSHNECEARLRFASQELTAQLTASGVPPERIRQIIARNTRRFRRRFLKR